MSLKYKHSLLLVDDEESITKSLRRLFRKEGYDIHSASSGPEALSLMKTVDTPFSLIISDQRMPHMNGAEFLEKAKAIFPHAIRILLTGYSDMDAIVDAVNKGEIHRFLTKPWNDEDFLLQVRQSLAQFELVVENRRLLALTKKQNDELKELNEALEGKVAERTREVNNKNKALASLNQQLESNLYNTVRAFAALVEMHTPFMAGHGRHVGMTSRRIAEQFGLSEAEIVQVEIAGLLHDIGKLGFAPNLLKYEEDRLSTEERTLFRKHPQNGQATVHFINKLDHAGLLIRSHHEQYDGQGYPDQLKEEEIPLGARIISVADAYDKIVNPKTDGEVSQAKSRIQPKGHEDAKPEKQARKEMAAQHLKQSAFTMYDPDVVKVFLEMLKSEALEDDNTKWVSLGELRLGMTVKKALYSSKGRFLIPSDTVLNQEIIHKLKTHYSLDLMNERICIMNESV